MDSVWIGFAGVSVALISLLFGVFKFLDGKIAATSANESKARHDQDNRAQQVFAELRREIKDGVAALERLRNDTVRREDHIALETRLTQQIGKVEAKVDGMVEKVAGVPVIQQQIATIGMKLDQIISKSGGD